MATTSQEKTTEETKHVYTWISSLIEPVVCCVMAAWWDLDKDCLKAITKDLNLKP